MSLQIKHLLISAMIILLLCNSVITQEGDDDEDGKEYYVDSSYKGYGKGTAEQPFKTIQDAIDNSAEGDTIYVFGGLYKEHITIDKKLHLWGGVEGTDSIIEDKSDHRYSVIITADYVEFQDFWLTDEHDYKSSPIGALISIEAENVVLTGNTLNNTDSFGIVIEPSAQGAIISGNTIDFMEKGIDVTGSTHDIVNNRIRNCTDIGIYNHGSSYNRIFDNTIKNCLIGINAENCDDLNISNNTFTENTFNAIQVIDCTNPIVKYNDIISNNAVGIYLDGNQGIVSYNIFEENNRGISIIGSSHHIHSNTFTSNLGAGIYAESVSKLNIIYNNIFEDNGKTAVELGQNTWYNENEFTGNYWDDYGWLDRNKNGIGDREYVKNGVMDPYPVGFFLQEPDKPSDPNPDDGETGVGLKPNLKVRLTDEDSELLSVTFHNAETDDLIGMDFKITTGDYGLITKTFEFDTTFAWYAIANDTYQENRSDIFFFTTMVTPDDNIPPIADIGGPYEADIGEKIQFDASASMDEDGTIDFYRWNFGDETSELLAQSPLHSYDSSGIYPVTLTVIDNQGSVDTKTLLVPIGQDANKAPVSNPGGPYTGTVGSPIVFDGTTSSDEDGDIQEYTWSFGDETTGVGSTISHTYTTKGSYLVVLTVTDSYGESHAESTIVTIEKKPDESPGFGIIMICIMIISISLIYKKYKI